MAPCSSIQDLFHQREIPVSDRQDTFLHHLSFLLDQVPKFLCPRISLLGGRQDFPLVVTFGTTVFEPLWLVHPVIHDPGFHRCLSTLAIVAQVPVFAVCRIRQAALCAAWAWILPIAACGVVRRRRWEVAELAFEALHGGFAHVDKLGSGRIGLSEVRFSYGGIGSLILEKKQGDSEVTKPPLRHPSISRIYIHILDSPFANTRFRFQSLRPSVPIGRQL